MAATVDLIRELHRLHKNIRDLKTEVDDAPKMLKTQQGKLSRAETNLHDAQEAIKHLKVEAHEQEVSLKATHQLIAKHEKQRNEAGDKKQYDALQSEINQERKNCSTLEDEILTIMSQIEEKTTGVPPLEKAVQQAKSDVTNFEKNSQERVARLTADLQSALTQLAEAEKTISSDLRPVYDRLIQAHGADGLAAVTNKTCTSCYKTITVQQQKELESGILVICKSCGRALYLQA
jgi:predicted  nucleic acid-binding Zn-ribbon protein